MCYNLFTKSVGRRKKTKHKKIWAAVLAAMLCFAGVLAGCKKRGEILSDVNKLHLSTSSWSSSISIVDDRERKEEVLDFFNDVEFTDSEMNGQEFAEYVLEREDYDPIKALCIMVFPNRERSFLLNIYPNGAVSTFVRDELKLADAGAVDYEGLKAVVERIEREERDKLKQGVE